jgi:hypothetical protein
MLLKVDTRTFNGETVLDLWRMAYAKKEGNLGGFLLDYESAVYEINRYVKLLIARAECLRGRALEPLMSP